MDNLAAQICRDHFLLAVVSIYFDSSGPIESEAEETQNGNSFIIHRSFIPTVCVGISSFKKLEIESVVPSCPILCYYCT